MNDGECKMWKEVIVGTTIIIGAVILMCVGPDHYHDTVGSSMISGVLAYFGGRVHEKTATPKNRQK